MKGIGGIFVPFNKEKLYATPLRGFSMLILFASMQFLYFKNKTKIIPIPSELSLVNRLQLIKMRYDDVIVYL